MYMTHNPEAKITIEGKEVTLLFGYTCYKLFIAACFRFRETYMTEAGELTGLGLTKLFHCAYINQCCNKELTPDITYDQFAEWVDEQFATEQGQKVIIELCEKWAQSKEVKKLQEATKEPEKKSEVPEVSQPESPVLMT